MCQPNIQKHTLIVNLIRNIVDSLYFETQWKTTKKRKRKKHNNNRNRPEKDSVAQCFISQKNEHFSKHTVSHFPHISRAQALAKCY